MVLTRKRAAEAPTDREAPEATPKRSKIHASLPGSPSPRRSPVQGGSLAQTSLPFPQARSGNSVPMKGSRGKAFLAAAGIAVPCKTSPPAASPLVPAQAPPPSSKKACAARAARIAADQAAAPPSVLPSAGKRRNPLLRQELPPKLTALLEIFCGLQTVLEMMRKRGQRTTFQNMQAAVEEASGRRFKLSHLGQLKQLLPEAVSLEWIRLPVAARSTRTGPHLLVSLDCSAATQAALAEGAVLPTSCADELQAARHLLHCRLAGHLLGSYRGHLASRAAELRAGGDEEAARQAEEAAEAAADPPVPRFLPPYPEGAPEVPHQKALPARPDPPTPSSRGAASPSVLSGAASVTTTAAAAAQAALPLTPTSAMPSGTTGRYGRPPMHPSTVARQRQQRRLSFGLALEGQAQQAGQRASKPGTPLDKLLNEIDKQHPLGLAHALNLEQEQEESQSQVAGDEAAAQQRQGQGRGQQLHPRQCCLAESLDEADLQWGGSIPTDQEAAVERARGEASLLASMPAELRRFSTDGIISLDTLRKLDAADQQHRRLSSQEALAARDVSAARGQLPRTFTLLQRIFGFQGPNALKLRDIVLRIKQGGAETSSEAQIEAQLRALAQHAPEYVTLKPYGSCGTPALWVNRAANSNALMQRLRGVAEARRNSLGSAS